MKTKLFSLGRMTAKTSLGKRNVVEIFCNKKWSDVSKRYSIPVNYVVKSKSGDGKVYVLTYKTYNEALSEFLREAQTLSILCL